MNEHASPSIIKVTGKGIVKRSAEVAEFLIEIEESGDDPAELMRRVVARNNRVVEMLRQELSDEEIIARGTMIRRHERSWWSHEDDADVEPEPAFDGASEIWVRTEKLDIVGVLMSRAMAAGASAVSKPAFGVKDPDSMTIEAISRAAQAARMRAETASEALGLTLGRPTKIESHTEGSGWGGDDSALFVGSARALSLGGPSDDWDIEGPTIIPPEQVLTQYVSATFEVLGPAE